MSSIKVAISEANWLSLLALPPVAATNEEYVEANIAGEINGIKTIYNPAENIIEQNFKKLGSFLSASLPPT